MRVRFTGRALADLDAIVAFLNERNPSAAAAVLSTIRQCIAQLSDFPLMGKPTRVSAVRCLIVSRYPYKVYYRVRRSVISIAHVRDSRRAPWKAYH